MAALAKVKKEPSAQLCSLTCPVTWQLSQQLLLDTVMMGTGVLTINVFNSDKAAWC